MLPGLADALEQVLSDPMTAAAMGKAGARRVEERFSTRQFVDGMVQVYADAARRPAFSVPESDFESQPL